VLATSSTTSETPDTTLRKPCGPERRVAAARRNRSHRRERRAHHPEAPLCSIAGRIVRTVATTPIPTRARMTRTRTTLITLFMAFHCSKPVPATGPTRSGSRDPSCTSRTSPRVRLTDDVAYDVGKSADDEIGVWPRPSRCGRTRLVEGHLVGADATFLHFSPDTSSSAAHPPTATARRTIARPSQLHQHFHHGASLECLFHAFVDPLEWIRRLTSGRG